MVLSSHTVTIDTYIDTDLRTKVKSAVDASLTKIINSREYSNERDILRHALFPGRRLRPLLLYLLLGHTSEDISSDHILELATCAEICHRASIILDDLIDGDEIRRHHLAFHKRFEYDTTSLVVVALTGIATERMSGVAHTTSPEMSTRFSRAFTKMAWGERCDISSPDPEEDPFQYYESRVLPKTSALFEFVFFAASSLLSHDHARKELFARVGKLVGEVYQMCNDIFDTITDSSMRKPTGETRVTFSLPFAVALKNSKSRKQRTLLGDSVGKTVSAVEAQEIESIVSARKTIAESRNVTEERIGEILELLHTLPDECIRHQLSGFLDWIQERGCWDQTEFTKAGY